MIFVNKDTVIGSKAFTMALADELRPQITAFLSDDELEDFELDLLQNSIHFEYLTDKQFNQMFDCIKKSKINDKQPLLKTMTQDPRFN